MRLLTRWNLKTRPLCDAPMGCAAIVECPTCGAAVGKNCKAKTGQQRSQNPHRERVLNAIDAAPKQVDMLKDRIAIATAKLHEVEAEIARGEFYG